MSQELEKQYGIFDFTDEEGRGTDLLPEVFKNSENVKKLVNIFMTMFQELHDAGKDMYSKINIFEAEGSQLDDIFGNIINVPRIFGEIDDDYRNRIIAETAQLARSGEIVVMKSVFRTLLGATAVRLFEYQPAAFRLEANVPVIPTDSQLQSIRNAMNEAKQGGNNMSLSVNDQTFPFRLGEFASPQLNSPYGFSGSGFTGGTLSEGF